MAEKKEDVKSLTKADGVTLEATRNIPLRMCVSDVSQIPRHLRRHPGGVRVEKGTKMVVTKEVAKTLKDLGYAKLVALLFVSLVLAAAVLPAQAQTNLTTTQAAVLVQEGPGYVVYSATVDTVGTDTFRTPAFHIGGLDKTCATTCLNLFAEAWASNGTGTEDVDITVEFSSDVGQPSNWDAASANAFTQVTTTAQFDTLSTIAGAVDQEFRSARWVRLVVAGQSGNPGDSDVTLRIYAVKPAALQGSIGAAVNNGS